MSVRVRFAPSPTGPLHIGGVRTALYNYLFARKSGGSFILRIEDTDQSRYVKGAEQYITETLSWCGISPDESVGRGGDYGPYRQSERKHIYRNHITKLIGSGNAYYAFDTPAEIEEMRNRLITKGVATPQYDFHVRENMKNSLTMSAKEVSQRIGAGEHYVIRMLIPENEVVTVHDIIRGEVKVHTSHLDDKVLFKSDGMPTYHLANIVDDHLMKITHVIRGEEWLPSAPLHVLLYKAFGWDIPVFAHLPLILKPEGNGKLSKRDGDRLGFPVFPLDWKDPATGKVSAGFRESGYCKEAFVNFLALLGWHPESEQELFTMDELIEAFSLDRVGKAGARFDLEKAKWFNQQYLKSMPTEQLVEVFEENLKEHNIPAEPELIKRVVELVRDRIVFAVDLWDHAHYFFQPPDDYDAKVIKKRWKPGTGDHLLLVKTAWETLPQFSASALKQSTIDYIEKNMLHTGQVMNCLRLAVVGAAKGPDLFDIIETLGKEETIQRIKKAVLVIEEK
ncbi:MAG: glutamate--tRNA ligase [Bacteroidales bacterium]|nr:glutamate--tRNA ligase [Bacteroidales bacterium]